VCQLHWSHQNKSSLPVAFWSTSCAVLCFHQMWMPWVSVQRMTYQRKRRRCLVPRKSQQQRRKSRRRRRRKKKRACCHLYRYPSQLTVMNYSNHEHFAVAFTLYIDGPNLLFHAGWTSSEIIENNRIIDRILHRLIDRQNP